MNRTLELTKELVSRQSVTPVDAGCQELLGSHLKSMGFTVEAMPFGDVNNLWAVLGDDGPLFVFAGHTDVVPPGPEKDWQSPPFDAVERDGYLFGRGTADMKASLAAMIEACTQFLATRSPKGRIGFLITSDEEGIAINGTKAVMAALAERGEQIDYCVVGEPSSSQTLGDVIRVGRRGSLSARLTVNGVEGHVAYSHLANNPIHSAMPALAALCKESWDFGNQDFPPTGMQISNINAGVGANNVIPGTLTADFNFRFSTESTAEGLKSRVHSILDAHALDYTIDWHLSGEPFLTHDGELRRAALDSIREVMSLDAECSTAGGTSDGRFIAPSGAQVIELGPCNASIHKVNECVRIADLEPLAAIYCKILERLV
jgi:succinyl-diaminopimelate desuccinylase